MALPFEDGLELISTAVRRDYEDKLFLRWIAGYQHMPFADFRKTCENGAAQRFDPCSKDEIMSRVNGIISLTVKGE